MPRPRRAAPADTSAEVHERQVARWRSMSVAEKATLVDAICRDVTAMALADIRRHHRPGSRGERRELVARRYGRPFADEVYGPEG